MGRLLAMAVVALGALLATAGGAAAQTLDYRPIDTTKYVVQPADTATNIFSTASRFVSRTIAGTIEGNGFVKTLNNLLGRSGSSPATTQNGFSPLPLPTTYPSATYKNSFPAVMPINGTYGQTPR